MARILRVLTALVCHVPANFESQTCNFERMATIQPGAQAMLGGLIGMHEQGKNGYGCGLPTASMQSCEALRYAPDLVNKRDEFLNGEFLTDYYVPGIRMGMRVMDTCSQEGVAVAGVGSIFPTIGSDSRQCTQGSDVTLGIIGTSNSGVTGKVATFSNSFEIPGVSYMATAPDLTDSGNSPNFLRTIPPDDDLMRNDKCVAKCPCYEGGDWFDDGYSATKQCKTKTCKNGTWEAKDSQLCTGSCILSGSNLRIKQFDADAISENSLNGNCEYVFFTAGGYEVKVRALLCGSNSQGCGHKVTIIVPFLTKGPIELYRGTDGLVMYNNQAYSKDLAPQVALFKTGLFTDIIFEGKLTVRWGEGPTTQVIVSKGAFPSISGLCGNFDGITTNDLQGQDNNRVLSLAEAARNWADMNLCADTAAESEDRCAEGTQKKLWAQSSCKVILEGESFGACRTEVTSSVVQTYYENCVAAACTCNCGSDCECLCDTIAAFAAVCSAAGFPSRFRHQRLCPIQCDYGSQYEACGSSCPKTCGTLDKTCGNIPCVEGCFCPNGYVRADPNTMVCIPESDCPCEVNGRSVPAGEQITIDCQQCRCQNGSFNCEGEKCVRECKNFEFKCTSGHCVRHSERCDSQFDCVDGSDEMNCIRVTCTESEFQCSEGCVPKSWRCDSHKDCANGEDELDCKDGIPNQWLYNPRQASLVVTEEGRTYQDPATGALHYVETITSATSRFQDMWGVAVATLAAIAIFVSLFIYLLVVYSVRGGTQVKVELSGLRRFGLGFVYAIAYSALFVKLKLVDCWRSRRKEVMFTVMVMVTVLLVLVQLVDIPSVISRFQDMWGVAVATLAAIAIFVSLGLFIYLLVVYSVRGGTHVKVELSDLRRFGLGFVYTIAYSALFVKLKLDCWRSRRKEVMFTVMVMVTVPLVLVQLVDIPSVISRFQDMWGVAVATLAAIAIFVSLALLIYLLVVYSVRGGTHVRVELSGLRRFGLGFVYTIAYSALFVKLKLVDCWRSRRKEVMFTVMVMVTVLLVLVQLVDIPSVISRFQDMWGVAVATLAAIAIFVSLALFIYLLVVYSVRGGTHVKVELSDLRRFGLGFVYAIAYSALFVKLKLVDCWRSRRKEVMFTVMVMVTVLLVLVQFVAIPYVISRFQDMWGVAVATLAAIAIFVSLALFIYLLVVYSVRGGTHVRVELSGLRRFGLGFVYTIAYSALFVKLKLVDCWRSRRKEVMFTVMVMVTVLLVLVQLVDIPSVISLFQDMWGVAVATLAAIAIFVSLALFIYLLVVYSVRGGTHVKVELSDLRRFGLGFVYAIAYSALFVKLKLVDCWRSRRKEVMFTVMVMVTVLLVLVQLVDIPSVISRFQDMWGVAVATLAAIAIFVSLALFIYLLVVYSVRGGTHVKVELSDLRRFGLGFVYTIAYSALFVKLKLVDCWRSRRKEVMFTVMVMVTVLLVLVQLVDIPSVISRFQDMWGVAVATLAAIAIFVSLALFIYLLVVYSVRGGTHVKVELSDLRRFGLGFVYAIAYSALFVKLKLVDCWRSRRKEVMFTVMVMVTVLLVLVQLVDIPSVISRFQDMWGVAVATLAAIAIFVSLALFIYLLVVYSVRGGTHVKVELSDLRRFGLGFVYAIAYSALFVKLKLVDCWRSRRKEVMFTVMVMVTVLLVLVQLVDIPSVISRFQDMWGVAVATLAAIAIFVSLALFIYLLVVYSVRGGTHVKVELSDLRRFGLGFVYTIAYSALFVKLKLVDCWRSRRKEVMFTVMVMVTVLLVLVQLVDIPSVISRFQDMWGVAVATLAAIAIFVSLALFIYLLVVYSVRGGTHVKVELSDLRRFGLGFVYTIAYSALFVKLKLVDCWRSRRKEVMFTVMVMVTVLLVLVQLVDIPSVISRFQDMWGVAVATLAAIAIFVSLALFIYLLVVYSVRGGTHVKVELSDLRRFGLGFVYTIAYSALFVKLKLVDCWRSRRKEVMFTVMVMVTVLLVLVQLVDIPSVISRFQDMWGVAVATLAAIAIFVSLALFIYLLVVYSVRGGTHVKVELSDLRRFGLGFVYAIAYSALFVKLKLVDCWRSRRKEVMFTVMVMVTVLLVLVQLVAIPSVISRFQDMWGVAVATLAAIAIFVSLALFIYLLVVYSVRGGTHVRVELSGLLRFGLGFVYTIAYSALFVKLKLVDCWRSRRKEVMFTVMVMVTVLLVLVQLVDIPSVISRFQDMWGVAVATLAAIAIFVSLALFIYLLVVYSVRGGTHVKVELSDLRRFGLGFVYAIAYSALFVKLKLVDCWRSRRKEVMFTVMVMVTVLLVLVQKTSVIITDPEQPCCKKCAEVKKPCRPIKEDSVRLNFTDPLLGLCVSAPIDIKRCQGSCPESVMTTRYVNNQKTFSLIRDSGSCSCCRPDFAEKAVEFTCGANNDKNTVLVPEVSGCTCQACASGGGSP